MAGVTASVVTMEAQLIAVSNVYMRGSGYVWINQGGKWGGVKRVSGEESRG